MKDKAAKLRLWLITAIATVQALALPVFAAVENPNTGDSAFGVFGIVVAALIISAILIVVYFVTSKKKKGGAKGGRRRR